MQMQNKLYGKTIIWNGDSICAGSRISGDWAGRIAGKNAMVYQNYAVGGGTITEAMCPRDNGAKRHSVSETLERMYEEYPNADYIIFEGGTNDADLIGSANDIRLGRVEQDYFGGDFDKTTFCGALESVFYRATKYWAGKKIAFIVAHKMTWCTDGEEHVRRFYFDKAIEICIKWGIPYIDLWNGCYLNPHLPWMYDPSKTPEENKLENTGFYSDGQHLTARGYDVTADIIDSWLKTL